MQVECDFQEEGTDRTTCSTTYLYLEGARELEAEYSLAGPLIDPRRW